MGVASSHDPVAARCRSHRKKAASVGSGLLADYPDLHGLSRRGWPCSAAAGEAHVVLPATWYLHSHVCIRCLTPVGISGLYAPRFY